MENTSVPFPLLGILISGRGSNMGVIIDAVREGSIAARIGVVIANRAEAAGLTRAREAGIETLVLPHRDYASRAAYDRALVQALVERSVTLVCLAGFMRLLGPDFCAAFPQRVLNVHPSLLPAFPGVDAQQQALDHGAKVSGATVHFVTPDLDAGPIILQACVPVRDSDTVATLAARILVEEHRIYPEAIRRILAGGWLVQGRRVIARNTMAAEADDDR